MIGTTVIIVILFPVAFQVFMLAYKQDKRHKEMMELLRKIEEDLKK
ncbi:hypothetical protein ACFLU5_14715 [Bacteroidota bacterium]